MFDINAWLVSSMVSIAKYFLLYRNERHILAVVTFSLMVILSSILLCTKEEEERAKKELSCWNYGIC